METPVSAVDLAEKYNYPELVRAVQLEPLLAHDVDDFGMTPLHWVCSDPLVPLRVLQKLVLVHPPATATKNLAGLLPLHIALRKNLPLDALKLLLKFYPKAITVATPDGRTPLELANEHVRASSTKLFLQMLDAEVRALGRAASAAKKTASSSSSLKVQQLRAAEYSSSSPSSPSNQDDVDFEPYTPREQPKVAPLPPSPTYRDPITALLSSPSMRAPAQQQRPPAWKLAKRCHICECKFGYFKSRHHCRNCGESVCSRHSRHSLPLRHIGLFHPQRVCAVCHEDLQNTRVGCNTNEASRSRGVSNASSRYSPTSEGYSAYRDDGDESASQRSSQRSLFWSPEAISPRLFNTPSVPTKRSKSVRNYLLGGSPRHEPNSPRADLAAAAVTAAASSPSARSVRSESTQRNYSHATLSTLPMFPSASSMFLTRVQLAPAPSQLVKPPRHERRDTSRGRSSSRANEPPSTDAAQRRRLAKTDLDAPSKAWYEELDQLPQVTSQKLSMDSRVSELEGHVQKLLVAKQQIRDALEKSQRQVLLARAEKDKYDAIAQKYLDAGYAELSPLATTDSPLQAARDAKETEAPQAQELPVLPSPTPVDNKDNNSSTCEQDGAESDRSTGSDTTWSSSVRPPSPAPQLSPFRSEQLELHIPLDVAATQHDLGVVLLGKGDYASAADAFRSALAIDSDNAVAWYHLAKALDGAGDAAAAERAVNKALALDSESLASLSLLGRLLHLRGEHDDAIVVFRRALKLQCPSGSDS